MSGDNVHANHRARMRKKYIDTGLNCFADHEALELLLYYCYPRRDTNEIAHCMIKSFGSLHNLMDANVEDIMGRCGVSENVAVLINMIPSLAKRYMGSKWSDKKEIYDVKAAAELVMPLFVDATVEMFYLICLDKQHRVNNVALLSEGTIDETTVHKREVIGTAIRHQASAVIISHNHPSGSFKPSPVDLKVTRELIEGLKHISVEVLDHIIVAGGKYYSMAGRRQLVAGYIQ